MNQTEDQVGVLFSIGIIISNVCKSVSLVLSTGFIMFFKHFLF